MSETGEDGQLVLYNTRTRHKEAFEPLEAGRVGIYSCGPTVYSAQHIGNLVPYMFADVLRRTLLCEGYEVTHVINITDVGHLTDDADAGEDKLERAARETGQRAEDIAEEYTQQWLRDRAAVGCLPPEVLCKATEHIAEQIEMIGRLEKKGYSYRIADGVYFQGWNQVEGHCCVDRSGEALLRCSIVGPRWCSTTAKRGSDCFGEFQERGGDSELWVWGFGSEFVVAAA